jgi:hypothetical protein
MNGEKFAVRSRFSPFLLVAEPASTVMSLFVCRYRHLLFSEARLSADDRWVAVPKSAFEAFQADVWPI